MDNVKLFLESINQIKTDKKYLIEAISEATDAIFEYSCDKEKGDMDIPEEEKLDQENMMVSDDELKGLLDDEYEDEDIDRERSVFKSLMKTDLSPEQIRSLMKEDGKVDFEKFSDEYEDQFLKYIDARIYGKHRVR